jgi:hypothetical protein
MSDDTRDLAEFANATGQPNQPIPHGHSLVRPTTGIAERIVGAQPVAVNRDELKIRQKLKALAAYAGEDWFYRFPVRGAGGSQSYIEGPSIKLANNVAREFGNNVTEVRELDVGDAWVFYARFTDIETGFSMERAYRQRKNQKTIRTKDVDRALDIVYQIGQSKAIRGVICNALGVYVDYAFEEARNSLVDKIGKDLAVWREKAIKGFARMAIAIERVERVIGRAAKDWTAPDLAQVIAMARSITDGMATADETFPPIEQVPAAAATSPTVPQSQTAGGGAQTEPAPPSEASAAQGTAEKSAAADMSQLETAYQRGIRAKAEDKRRANIPREYTDGNHDELAASWLAGFDGKELTTKQEGKSND